MKETYVDGLTVEDGIKIQQLHLAQWERVLKPEYFAKLKAHAEKDNDKAKTGYDICRGDRLYEFVANNLMR